MHRPENKCVARSDFLFAVDRAMLTNTPDDQHNFHEIVVVQGDTSIEHRSVGADRGMARKEEITAYKSNGRRRRSHSFYYYLSV